MQTKDSLQTYTIMEKSEAEACLDLAVSLVRENLRPLPAVFRIPTAGTNSILKAATGNGPPASGPGKYGWHMSGPGRRYLRRQEPYRQNPSWSA